MPSKPTNAEQAWINKLQSVLDECPSGRLGAFTIGDESIVLFVSSKYEDQLQKPGYEEIDVCKTVEKAGAQVGQLRFPFQVWSTAG